MKLISEIEIKGFRSIRSCKLEGLGDFTTFAGLNNSGKSNVLRALNAFFNGETDEGSELNVDADYYRPDLRQKKAKRISVSVRFALPSQFKFRKGLQAVETMLGDQFTITKNWDRKNPLPGYLLNGEELGLDQRQRVDQFLQMVTFRYIPNRVLPIDIIRREHQSLRDVLIRRLSGQAKKDEATFSRIKEISDKMILTLSKHVSEASVDIGSVRLATPTSWKDMVFAFGYKLGQGGIEMDDAAQGAGIQSLLMLETLHLIDRDYFQKFGWRQAAIWALEEPESSLHTSLEARIAAYLSSIASDQSSRLQVLCTTHSDLVLQHSGKTVIVTKKDGETVLESTGTPQSALDRLCRAGISRWVHPILYFPLDPVILVEGKNDSVFFEEAFKFIRPKRRIHTTYLELLEGGGKTGGKDDLLEYVKANAKAIKARSKDAPVIVVLDWDAAKKVEQFKKHFTTDDPFQVMAWPESAFNPKLGKSFRGIERHFSDRIITTAIRRGADLHRSTKGAYSVPADEYGAVKAILNSIVAEGLKEIDLKYARAFLEELVRKAEGNQ